MKSQQSGVVDIDKDEMKQIGDIISDLKKSPVFNMSLTSKELFHSNFIAWLIETNEIDSSPLLKLFLGGDRQVEKKSIVEREVPLGNRKKIDFKITTNDGRKIFVENKVKSIPDQSQLDEYAELIKNKHGLLPKQITCILLSLTSSDLFKNGIYKIEASYDWRFVSYKELVSALKEIKPAKDYHKDLIKDYAAFVEHLCAIHKVCETYWKKDEVNLLSCGDGFYKKMETVRLHDIYEKWRMSELKEHLKNSGKLLIVDYTRGAGILNIDPSNVPENSFFTSLQVQGDKLKQTLRYKAKKGNKEIFEKAKMLLEDGMWFLDKDDKPLGENTKTTENEIDLGFCKYDRYFAYRYEIGWNIDRVIELAKKIKVLG